MRTLSIIALISIMIMGSIIAEDQLVITGSTTVLPIAQACAEEYMDANEDADITIRGGGSGVGIAALIDKQCDIANASRKIKTKEIANAKTKGVKPVNHTVAWDAIAVIVNPVMEIDNLSLEQLKDIYSGKITNWKKVGGPNKQIVIISRDVSSGTFEVFNEIVLDGATVCQSALKVASNQAVSTTVKNTPYAIGYIGLGYLNKHVKAIDVNDVEASVENAQNETYPIIRALHMYTDGEPRGMAKLFLDYVMSSDGQEIVADMGYIPISKSE